jgi:hypothetical protein
VLSGHRDGHLRCFDLRTNSMLSSSQLTEGISSLSVHQNNIAIGTLTGEVLTFKHDDGKFISFPELPTQNKSMMTVWGLKNLKFPTNSFVSVGKRFNQFLFRDFARTISIKYVLVHVPSN